MNYQELKTYTDLKNVTLVAVSKTKPPEDIKKLYDKGQRIFGENKVQEILSKAPLLPKDIQWHMIGHLQSNKVKAVLPYVDMIQSVDSLSLLQEINKEAHKINKVIKVLLEVKIAIEDTKYGFSKDDIDDVIHIYNQNLLSNIQLCGLMGMASFIDDSTIVSAEFATLKNIFDQVKSTITINQINFNTLSMGMSGDYELAVEQGSNMIRIGSLLFGKSV